MHRHLHLPDPVKTQGLYRSWMKGYHTIRMHTITMSVIRIFFIMFMFF